MPLSEKIHNGPDSEELRNDKSSTEPLEDLEWQEIKPGPHPLSVMLKGVIDCFGKIIELENKKFEKVKNG